MAQMHPRNGPKEGTQSNAERKLYGVLRALPASWHVVHSAERFSKAGNGKPVRGEIDFLIIHPDYGVLVVEVKGGRISYDDATGRWTTTDSANQTHPLTPSPFTQVDDALRLLKTFIKNALGADAGAYPLARAVWFSDVEWTPRHLLEFPDELILDRRNLANAQAAIERAFTYNKITQVADKLPPAAMARLLTHLVPDFPPPTLSEAISLDQRLIDLLTAEQSTRLTSLLQTQRQCAIPGEAGTGKTILAFETARLLARSRWRTLLVCVNAFQAQWLKEKQDAECDVTLGEQFDICDIADLCGQYARRAGITDSIAAEQVVETKGQNRMASLLQRSIERLRHRTATTDDWHYDAVLIDEGQDIEKPLLSAISHLLRDRRDGYFCVWYDPFQRLDFDTDWQLPIALHTTPPLTQNLRNSRAIWDAMAVIRPDLHLFDFTGPEGAAITYIQPPVPTPTEGAATDDATGDAVRAVLRDLIGNQGIAPGDILLITCRPDRASQWKAWRDAWRDEISLRALTQLRGTKDEDRARYVKFSTIRASKGLESNIVILVELDGIAQSEGTLLPTLRRRDKLLYVAISRARHGLYVVGPPGALAPLAPPA